MYLDMKADNSNATQRALLLGGEVSMWQDAYVGSCLFGNQQDANFSQSASHCIWPRTAIFAGTVWGGHRNISDGFFERTFSAVTNRLAERNVDSCPCANLTSNGCSQMGFCGAGYCGALPSPPPPPGPSCPAFAPPGGFSCLGSTAGNPKLLIKAEPAACKGAKPWGCSTAAATICSGLEGCEAFSMDAKKASYFKADPKPPTPASPAKQLFAVPCDPSDPNQVVTLSEAGQLVMAAGLCVDVGCDPKTKTSKDHAPLALATCDPANAGQQWTHSAADAQFVSGCGPHHCIDLYDGGRSDEAGLCKSAANAKTLFQSPLHACALHGVYRYRFSCRSKYRPNRRHLPRWDL
jgi:hypothetical protein